jgi:hypothetical protein
LWQGMCRSRAQLPGFQPWADLLGVLDTAGLGAAWVNAEDPVTLAPGLAAVAEAVGRAPGIAAVNTRSRRCRWRRAS